MKQSPKKPEFNVDEESKMMEDDIDKLVAEMISKPYDSSRYQDSPSNKKKEPSSKINPNTAK